MSTHRARRWRGRRLLLWSVAIVLVGSSGAAVAYSLKSPASSPRSDKPSATPTTEPTLTPAATPTPTVPPVEPLVLAISVDGLNPDSIGILGQSGAPNFHRLMREGAHTLNARASLELTITLPNHTGMLTGRRIAGPDGHNVTFNDESGETLSKTHGSYVPGMFDVAHDNGLQTAMFAEKDKFGYLIRSWDATHGAPDTTGEDNGRDKLDLDVIGSHTQLVAATQKALTDGKTDIVFLHLRAPDSAGHSSGWLGSRYLKAVQSVDADLGLILDTIENNPKTKERATLLLTADHGGPRGEKSHSKTNLLADYRIPFITWGRNVAPGADLYELNAGRKDPGQARPDYDAVQPVRNMDIANTALSVLGLDPIPAAVSTDWPRLSLTR